MRSRGRDRKPESFHLRRNVDQSGVAGGALGWRLMLLDVVTTDATEGKIIFVPNADVRFVGREYEVWHFSFGAFFPTAPAVGDLLGVGYTHSALGLAGLSVNYTPAAFAGSYSLVGSVVMPVKPGEHVIPMAYSNNATNNNLGGSWLTFFAGFRVG